MISPAAIKAYKDQRYLVVDTPMKAWKTDELRAALSHVHFHTPPYHHQLVCTYLGLRRPAFAFFLEMGLGKSKIMLDILRARNKPGVKALILVPYLIHLDGWEEQAKIHAPDLRVACLRGSSQERTEWLSEDFDVAVLNYGGLVAMCTNRGTVSGKRRKTVAAQLSTDWIDLDMARLVAQTFSTIVGDESTAFKNHRTRIFQLLRHLQPDIPHRYILTGTPFGKSPHDLWTQLYFVDGGKSLGPTISFFRAVYFREKRNRWKGFEYTFRETSKPLLTKRIGGSSICYRSSDCLDLPDQTYQTVRVDWPVEGHRYYKEVVNQIEEVAVDDKQKLEGHFMRLRQICSGFLHSEEGTVDFVENPKLDAAGQIVESIPEESKFVVFHFFVHSGELLSAKLRELGIKHARIYSGTQDREAQLRAFKHDARVRGIIINETIGAMGLNLQVANYCLFYECPLSPIVREQASRRIFGRLSGDKTMKPAFYFDLVMKSSVEEKILGAVLQGRELLREILAGRQNLR